MFQESIEEITKPMNDMWDRRNAVQYVSQKQNGPIAGHYLKIDGTCVVAYALCTDPKCKQIFKCKQMFTAFILANKQETKTECESHAAVSVDEKQILPWPFKNNNSPYSLY